MARKPSLSWKQQVQLLRDRGLGIADGEACTSYLAAQNHYRFSGYARYFQRAPHDGDDSFADGVSFEDVRAVCDADEALRQSLRARLAHAEILLRSRTAHVIAREHGPYECYLEKSFYSESPNAESTVDSCLRDIERSRERHVLRFTELPGGRGAAAFGELPVWSAVEAWSFGTLSRCIERGARGSLAGDVASGLGVARAGFAYRVRALVYLRNRCAHHSRLWNHSVIDAGPTPNNVRAKAKRLAGQFTPRSVVDVIASLDDILLRGADAAPILPELVAEHSLHDVFWRGLTTPRSPLDHRGPQ
ncbi:abortive phage resistance protein [Rathayibacter sp. AY1E4]|uniref:Abi family protein n=1 Tax=unclassified Rathayibacter TaxID=2609250 RepID=UPI000CE83D12|nr:MULTISPECIES: Abi family protein [unclassified Rathayibacter]PPH07706.1 abortive phage resistance protein [Rathayibacter sp. AY1C1]PPH40548.1 abortive phage resistance protein [Rathayibacter sp. AY1E4]